MIATQGFLGRFGMRLRLRLLWLIFASFFKKPISLLDESVITLWVLPNDVDITKITNDRYVTIMDLGRMDYAFRVGLRSTMVKKKWIPVATFVNVRFRYPLRIFQRYQLKTRILWWDEKVFYWEQTFLRDGRVLATGHVGGTVHHNGIVPSSDVLAIIGRGVERPNMPDSVARLIAAERLIHDSQKD